MPISPGVGVGLAAARERASSVADGAGAGGGGDGAGGGFGVVGGDGLGVFRGVVGFAKVLGVELGPERVRGGEGKLGLGGWGLSLGLGWRGEGGGGLEGDLQGALVFLLGGGCWDEGTIGRQGQHREETHMSQH